MPRDLREGKKIACALLLAILEIPISALDQQAKQPQDVNSAVAPYVRITSGPTAGTMVYEDEWDGFRFEYPILLHPDDLALSFRNSDDSNVIALHTEFSSTDPKGYLNLRKYLSSLSISNEVINGMNWVRYSGNEGAGYYIYRNGQQVSIEGIVEGNPAKPLSKAELSAMRQMVATLNFDPVSSRMDFKIAALKVGEKHGSLRVSRIVTRAMANDKRKRYWTNPAGEVDFSGSLTLTGHIENQQTMNSGPHWVVYGIDTAFCATLPQIGYPLDCKKLPPPIVISLTNGDFVARQFPPKTYSDDELTIVLADLSEVFYGRGLPSFSAKLIKIIKDE